MSWFVLLGVAIGLAMDAFAAAVAVSVSLRAVSRLGRRFGAWAEVAGGVVLIGIGILIVIDHS
jgi:putative Mn2+ efflux pump MntP